jgi:hypothetical protein
METQKRKTAGVWNESTKTALALGWFAREIIHFANSSRTDLNEGLRFGDID